MSEKDLFLCHNGADKPWVFDLGKRIEAEAWDGRPLTVFIDAWDIDVGENIVLKLNEALAKCRYVGVVMTPELINSEWCRAELAAALTHDPTNRLGRIIPIRLRDIHKTNGTRLDVPPFLAALNFLDFRSKNDFARSFARLLAKLRGEAPPRGGTRGGRGGRGGAGRSSETGAVVAALPETREEPDPVAESLIGNLLPVNQLPTSIWSVPTSLKSKRDLPTDAHYPPFILREDRLYTFIDLSSDDHPFRGIVATRASTREATVTWRSRGDRWNWFIELLNLSLTAHLRQQGVGYDHESRRYYFQPKAGKPVRVRWGSGDTRTVVRAPDPGQGGYWVHQAARLRFETLGMRVYLSVDPAWTFTIDGHTPAPRDAVGPLAMQWGGKERNGTILRHVLMWSDVLANGRKNAVIACGAQQLVIGRLPTTVQAPVSIQDDRVRVRALLEFTRIEQDLVIRNDPGFYVLPDTETAPEEADDVEA